jgi:hypothetical protein
MSGCYQATLLEGSEWVQSTYLSGEAFLSAKFPLIEVLVSHLNLLLKRRPDIENPSRKGTRHGEL